MKSSSLCRTALSTTLLPLLAFLAWFFPSATPEANGAVALPQLVLSEFSANNGGLYSDEDGDSPDWIELHNTGTTPVSLLHWSLTDSRGNLNKWRFPETNIVGGGFLVVFASEKNRTTPGKPLHTNFKLDDGGEYLALIDPAGQIVSQFEPKFPKQLKNISYGYGMEQIISKRVSSSSTSRVWVPTDGTLDGTWYRPEFNDAPWTPATASLGFEGGSDPVEDFYPTAILSRTPLIYLRMNETNGTQFLNQGTLGTAANGVLNGTVSVNQPSLNPPLFNGFESTNRAFRFSASGTGAGRVRISDAPELHRGQGAFSISLWVFPTSIATRGDLLSYKGTNQEFSIQTSSAVPNQLSVFHNGYLGTGGTLSNSTWYHLAISRTSEGLLTAYLDGNEIFSATDSQPLDIAADLILGSNHRGNPTNPQFGFNGRIDEFAFFDRALESEEIRFLHQVARGGGSSFSGQFTTDLGASMKGKSSSVYVRIPFTIEDPLQVDRLLMKVRFDDGFAAYINGELVAEVNTLSGAALGWNSTAATRRGDAAALEPELFNLTDAREWLRSGTNILAIHGLNATPTQSDFLLVAELESTEFGGLSSAPRYFRLPTPGEANGVGTFDLGPIIGAVQHTPQLPKDSDAITVTAEVAPSFSPVARVNLLYAVNYGTTNVVEMKDDGLNGDGAPLDGIYGAVIPASAAAPGQLVRYKIQTVDASGASARWPLFEDPLGSPEFLGTVIEDPASAGSLPVWQWFALRPDGARNRTGTRVSVFFNGEYYDNIYARERGGATTIGSQKFDFNRDFRCQIIDGDPRVDEANLNASGSDTTYLRPPIAFGTYRKFGNPACLCFTVQMRLNGRADRLANYVEQVDESFLRRNGINDNGVLYKMVQRGSIDPVFSDSLDGVEKKTHKEERNLDLQEIVDAIKRPTVQERVRFFMDKFNIPNWINFLAIRPLTMDADDVRKNFYIYLNREDSNEWMIFPWDKDWTFGITGDGGDNLPHPFFGSPAFSKPDTQANVLYKVFFNDPPLREMMLRRLRTVMDEQLQAPWVDPSDYRYEPWVDELAAMMPNPSANATAVADLKSYFPRRRQDLYVTYNVLGTTNLIRGVVPDAQPANISILFGSMEVTPASGDPEEEYVQLVNTNSIAVDVSGWKVSGAIQHTLAAGTVIPSNNSLYLAANVRKFRGRAISPKGGEGLFVQGNYKGQLSTRGESLVLHDQRGRLVTTSQVTGEISAAQKYLRISEIMFAPLAPALGSSFLAEDFEYLELANVGPETLDLSGVQLNGAVRFQFPTNQLVLMPAGAFWVLASNTSAYTQRYPGSPAPFATFTGSLNNSGESLALYDARGEKILEFQYEADWYPTTRSLGFSLSAVNLQQPYDGWDQKSAWQPSGSLLGSPGISDVPVAIPHVIVSEVLANGGLDSDAIELHNPTPAVADISGWYVSGSRSNPRGSRIPTGTILQPGAFWVYRASQWNQAPWVMSAFNLSSLGDAAYLFSANSAGALTGYSDGFDFGASDPGVTQSLFSNSLGKTFAASLVSATLGSSNAPIQLGPVVISEIHFHPPNPPDLSSGRYPEFIEIQNRSDAVIRLNEPTQSGVAWRIRGDVEYDFPTNAAIAPHGSIVLVPFNPSNVSEVTEFVRRYGLRAIPRMFGPYSGQLPNEGGQVRLERPARFTPPPVNGSPASPVLIAVDEVHYNDRAPWPELADGFGPSLSRRHPLGFADDPTSWIAARPTPGADQGTGSQPPIITAQPESVISRAFESTRFTVRALGTGPLQYQWFLNQNPIQAATGPTFQIRSGTPEDEGVYQVAVYDDVGSVLSNPAQLGLIYPPIITVPPTNRVTRLGQKTDFRVVALGHGRLSYQWSFNGSLIAGATNSTLSLTNISSTQLGAYVVEVRDQIGSTLSPPALLQLAEPPQFLQPPVNVEVVPGGVAVFSVEAAGAPPFTYRWRRGSSVLATEVSSNPRSFLVFTNTSTNFLVLQGQTNYQVSVNNASGGVTNQFRIVLLADNDLDGMGDLWETQNGLSSSNPTDALLDADLDGMSNLAEFVSRTDPRDASDHLKLELTPNLQGQVTVHLHALAGLTYAVESTDSVQGGKWTRLLDVVAKPDDRDLVLPLTPETDSARFFRVITPWRP